jgi:asparagine synthase (glutamine-hydrolysing)
MCGIAGFAGRSQPETGRIAVQKMVHSLRLRGPDSEGIESWPGATLGHRRLSILDLSPAGRQPMVTEDGAIGLVFNGCVYNFQELRADLEREGCRFRSQTDTEILLLGYRQWGVQRLVERCRGMFAFAVWDNNTGELTLVRDRLGVKPLVYAEKNGTIAFASTVRALHDAGFTSEPDPVAVLEFLEFGWVSEDRCIYKNAFKVPAAGMIQWRDGVKKTSIYWKPPAASTSSLTFEDAVAETERLLLEAVQLRLIADVPIGSLLSGGIDSALIAWALKKLNADVKCYTVGTPGHPSDESADSARTAAYLGVAHETIPLDVTQPPELSELIGAYGEPFACSSALGMLTVCRAVKPKATVLLTGDGGDDVFLGYTHHRNFLRAQTLAQKLPNVALKAWPSLRHLLSDTGVQRRAKHLLDYAAGGLGAITQTHDGLPYFHERSLLGPALLDAELPNRQIPWNPASGRRALEDFLPYEWSTRFLAEYMTKVDGAAMRYAIEARSPFLDQRIWEMAAALPASMRLQNGELKAILRELVRRRISPEVASRRKQGFTIPVSDWLVGPWRAELESLLDNPRISSLGWIDGTNLKAAVNEALANGKASVQLWYLVVLEKWLQGEMAAGNPHD